ncbi:glycosyltransferase family 2 protein [Virgibacillus halophilus]|uniref:Glycosyltransferase family 2 protein n=1 Tax=Tigheibacillus halophilus TaxID=361280 RepID=A0ABU5C4Z8_9BACI|nr:glycosyltransferase family 2 protein [Virgibacillus halophilus]
MSVNDIPLISVVVPVYGCRTCLKELAHRVTETVDKIPARLELIFINDASPDGAWDLIDEMSSRDTRIKGINFARNFGQHRAITAGIDHAAGDWVVVMDCDLQDKPEEIDRLYRKALEGYDIVFGKRYKRQDKWLKRKGSQLFYKIFDYFTERSSDHMIANYSISNKKGCGWFSQHA